MLGKHVNYFALSILLSVWCISCGEKQEPAAKPIELQVPQAQQTSVVQDTSHISIQDDTAKVTYKVLLKTTAGTITLGLFGEDAPKTVYNFRELIAKHYYDGIVFHRVVKGFVIQAGDPQTRDTSLKTLWGNKGDTYNGKALEDECDTASRAMKHGYIAGTVVMANAMKANSASSQFFVCLDSLQNMPPRYAIFGKVLAGMDVVQKIGNGETDPDDGRGERPLQPVKIISVEIKEQSNNQQSQKDKQ